MLNTDASLGADAIELDGLSSQQAMKLGILKTGCLAETLLQRHGDHDDLFRRALGNGLFEIYTYSVYKNQFPASAVDADAWLITGSSFNTVDDDPWMAELSTLVCDIYDRRIPMLGVCFGHQIVAQALGGTVAEVAVGWQVGAQTYHFMGDLARLKHTSVYVHHQYEVVQPPDSATTCARSDTCAHTALLYDAPILTVQCHPEFTRQLIEDSVNRKNSPFSDQTRASTLHSLAQTPVNNRQLIELLTLFLLSHRTSVNHNQQLPIQSFAVHDFGDIDSDL